MDLECVDNIKTFILDHTNPFRPEETDAKNIVSVAIIPDETTQHCLNGIEIGDECYKDFVTERLHKKSKKLFDPVKKRTASQRTHNILLENC